ncbi:MAG TPA: hypothetical protein ENK50_08090, partial [Sedimenticola sp.]|nr:hypothetical protein [Sedimenticola sp.]
MTDPFAGSGWLLPRWPAPPRVRAVSTTRRGGVSVAPYDTLNLGDHVGDDPAAVRRNRVRLGEVLGLPAEPRWLQQVHGCEVLGDGEGAVPWRADAATSAVPGVVCAVLT